MHYGISNEESYEKAKSRITENFEQHINDVYNLDSLDILDCLELLQQSKWRGEKDGKTEA